jgi:hypothetical protein
MTTSKNSFYRILGRALLCLALFAATLAQNFGHLADEAAAQSSIAAMPAGADPHVSHDDDDDEAPCGTPIDCGDYACHLLAPRPATFAIYPMRHALAIAIPDNARSAHLPRPDEPPRG